MTIPDASAPRCGVDPDLHRWTCVRMTTAGLCTPCAEKVGAWVAELTDLLPQLPDALIPGSSGEGPRVSGSREAPMPVRAGVLSFWGPAAGRDRRYDAVTGLDPVDHKGDPLQVGEEPVGSVLATWARVVVEEKPLPRLPDAPWPPRPAGAPYGPLPLRTLVQHWQWLQDTRHVRRALALRRLLAAEHAWMVRQPWADTYAADLFDTWRHLRTLLGLWDPRPQHLKGVACPACDAYSMYRTPAKDGRDCLVAYGGCGRGFTDEEYERWTRLSAHFARTAGLRPAPYQRQRQMDGEWLRVKAAQDRTGHQFGCDCPACVPTDNQQMEAA